MTTAFRGGVDVGGTKIQAVVTGRGGKVLGEARRGTPRAGGPEQVAEDIALALPETDRLAALAAHPRIGERSPEQHGGDREVLAKLARLNEEYERRFGFAFVVFVNGRPREELLPVLQTRLGRTREQELDTGLRELCAIARDRWTRTT